MPRVPAQIRRRFAAARSVLKSAPLWLALALGAVLAVINWHGELVHQGVTFPAFGGPGVYDDSYFFYEHGWPWTYLKRGGKDASAWSHADGMPNFSPGVLAQNAAMTVTLMTACGVFLALRRRWRGSLLRFTTRDALVCMALMAAALGWWKYEERQADVERRIGEILRERGHGADFKYCVPFGLSRFLGHKLPPFKRITGLIMDSEADEREAQAIAEIVGPPTNLRSIYFFYGTKLSDEGLAILLRGRRLESLSVHASAFTGVGLKALPSDCLRELRVSGSSFNDQGAAELARQRRLEELYLDYTELTNEGFRHIAGLTELKEVSLSGTKITDASLSVFANLKNLVSITLPHERQFSANAKAALQEMLPDAGIDRDPVPDSEDESTITDTP